jgi:2-C-methyl-D-erythritol 4-phosphate cytidylyltransferase/2-C-methyl-D-erythritol 2,4-cyclodiphosphate synthase
MDTAVIIVAAGRGTRAGGDAPKQWQLLAGQPVLAHTVARFADVGRIIVVLHPEDMAHGVALFRGAVVLCAGGQTRDASVRNALEMLEGSGVTRVLIHDGARPLVSPEVIDGVLTALDTHRAAAPALAVSDALWIGANGQVTGTQDRTNLWRAQTPQGFDFDTILAAHRAHPGGAADDVEVVRAAGVDVAITPGSEDNLKITYPADFARAERILGA